MHEYSSISSSAFDITIASTPCVSSSNWNLSISSLSEERMQFLLGLQFVQKALVELDAPPKEYLVGLGELLVEDRVAPKR